MARYFLELAYKGTHYVGWQRQPNGISVQERLENALSTVLRQPTTIVGSGRTDAGVHAEQQFAHFETDVAFDAERLVKSLNGILGPDIAIYGCVNVAPDHHARFSATERYYQYRISRRRSPFLDKLRYVFHAELDVAAMNEAAATLLQHEDFESFSKVKTEVNHFRCRITEARWDVAAGGPAAESSGADGLTFHIRADRFLRGMVRAIVGTLLEVGQGRMTVAEFEQVILAKDRRKASRAAPAEGLFLVGVRYPV